MSLSPTRAMMVLLPLLTLLSSPVLGWNLYPDSTTCTGDSECAIQTNATSAWVTSNYVDPSQSFYACPGNFSDSLAPGTLLSVEPLTNTSGYSVPMGLSMSRITYTSEDLDGRIVPVSGYVLWPYDVYNYGNGSSTSNMPMVAWSHGTTGVFQGCAPSNYQNLQYHFQVPFALALQGIAVVATDYAGLGIGSFPNGTTVEHAWITAPAQANDVANSVTAARAAFPDRLQPDGPFVAMGHSQGGASIWAFAERQANQPLDGYQGTVSFAPPPRILDDYQNYTNEGNTMDLSVEVVLVDSISKIYPEYNYSGNTDLGNDRWFNVLRPIKACFPTIATAMSSNTTLADYAKHNWWTNPYAVKWQDRVQVGRKNFASPLLVVNGLGDQVVRPAGVQSAVDDTCAMIQNGTLSSNLSLEHATYDSMNHFSVIHASEGKWLQWTKDRLKGEQVQGGCKSDHHTGLIQSNDYSIVTPWPNFFLKWYPQTEFWKYTL